MICLILAILEANDRQYLKGFAGNRKLRRSQTNNFPKNLP